MKKYLVALFAMTTGLFGFNYTAYSSTLFQDTFQNSSDLNQWSPGGGIIKTAPGGGNALTFNNTASGGHTYDIYTTNSFTSSTGSFTISFDLLGNCGQTSGCGAFVYASGGIPQVYNWITSDTQFGGIPLFPDTIGTWEHVSYTFSGSSTNLGLEIWSNSPYAAPDSVFFRNMVLTDNSTGIPVGVLNVSSTPLPPSIAMLAPALLGLGAYRRKMGTS